MEKILQNYSELKNSVLKQIGIKLKINENRTLKNRIIVSSFILVFSGMLALSYFNGNVFLEKIAVSFFIISCVLPIKITGD